MAKRGPQRTRFEAERDRAVIQQYYLRKMSQTKIAELLNADTSVQRSYTVTHDMVQIDLDILTKRWRANHDLAEERARVLAEIGEVKRSYWEAWQDSPDNPTLLAGVLACIERECKLLGIDAPPQIMSIEDWDRAQIIAHYARQGIRVVERIAQ